MKKLIFAILFLSVSSYSYEDHNIDSVEAKNIGIVIQIEPEGHCEYVMLTIPKSSKYGSFSSLSFHHSDESGQFTNIPIFTLNDPENEKHVSTEFCLSNKLLKAGSLFISYEVEANGAVRLCPNRLILNKIESNT